MRRHKTINRAVKKRLCLDFDGVIYNNKYRDNRICLDNPPIDGVVDFCRLAQDRFKLLVNSARCEDEHQIGLIQQYLNHYGINAQVTRYKPTAHYYVDDRAVRFDGDWGSVSNQVRL